MKRTIAILSALVVLVSCQDKTLEEVVVSSPVFTFKALANGEPIELAAGENNSAMTFATEQDFFGIYNYNGRIAPANCADCGPSVHIKIFGLEEKGPNDNPNYTNDLAIGERGFLTNASSTEGFTFHFFANENDSDLEHYWTFGDGGVSTQMNPEHTYALAGTYEIVHTIENEDNISTTSTFQLEVGNPNGFCSLPFQVNEMGPNNFHFHHPFNMPDFLEGENWTIYNQDGDLLFDTEQSNFDLMLPQGDVYEVCLSFENEITGCEGLYCLTIDNTNPGPFKDPGFQIAPEPTQPVIGKVLVEYRDNTGSLYSSAFNENQFSDFEIVESEYYTPINASSPIARKLKLVFNCTLKNINNPSDIIALENAEAVFAFETE